MESSGIRGNKFEILNGLTCDMCFVAATLDLIDTATRMFGTLPPSVYKKNI